MTEFVRFGPGQAMVSVAEIRPVAIEDLSTIRYIHATALRITASHFLSEEEVEAFRAHVYSHTYSEALQRQALYGAYVDGELIGTAGWTIGDDSGSCIRLRSVFVRPLFGGIGLGRRLVHAVEELTRGAGYRAFSVRATINAQPFFERLGYTVTSHGVRTLLGNVSIPVAFMRKVDPPVSTRPH